MCLIKNLAQPASSYNKNYGSLYFPLSHLLCSSAVWFYPAHQARLLITLPCLLVGLWWLLPVDYEESDPMQLLQPGHKKPCNSALVSWNACLMDTFSRNLHAGNTATMHREVQAKVSLVTVPAEPRLNQLNWGLILDNTQNPIPLLGLYPKNPKTPIQKILCTPMFIAAQFIIASVRSNLSAHQ